MEKKWKNVNACTTCPHGEVVEEELWPNGPSALFLICRRLGERVALWDEGEGPVRHGEWEPIPCEREAFEEARRRHAEERLRENFPVPPVDEPWREWDEAEE